jgi:hypothetical protein
MAMLSAQPLSKSQHRLRGRKIVDMNDAQLRGWKDSRIAAQAELERRQGAGK